MDLTPAQARCLIRINDATDDKDKTKGLHVSGRVARIVARDLVRLKLARCIDESPSFDGNGTGTYVITELGVSVLDKIEEVDE